MNSLQSFLLFSPQFAHWKPPSSPQSYDNYQLGRVKAITWFPQDMLIQPKTFALLFITGQRNTLRRKNSWNALFCICELTGASHSENTANFVTCLFQCPDNRLDIYVHEHGLCVSRKLRIWNPCPNKNLFLLKMNIAPHIMHPYAYLVISFFSMA